MRQPLRLLSFGSNRNLCGFDCYRVFVVYFAVIHYKKSFAVLESAAVDYVSVGVIYFWLAVEFNFSAVCGVIVKILLA